MGRSSRSRYFGLRTLCVAGSLLALLIFTSLVASSQNPKLTALLDDLARAVPQQQGAIPLGTRVAPPLGFSIEAMPKSVRDAHRSRMLRINGDAEVQVYILVAEVSDDNLRALRTAGV